MVATWEGQRSSMQHARPDPQPGCEPKATQRCQRPGKAPAHTACTAHHGMSVCVTAAWAHLAEGSAGAAALPKVPGLSVRTRLHVSPVNSVLAQSQ